MTEFRDVAELRKALEAGYGTPNPIEGGGAFGRQSLSTQINRLVAKSDDYILCKLMPTNNIYNTMDEYTTQQSIGGFLGGTANTETGQIKYAQGKYKRVAAFVKYLTTSASVSVALQQQDSITQPETEETMNAMLRLLRDKEFLIMEGDSAVVPEQFDGIKAQLRDRALPENIIDMNGSFIDSIAPLTSGAEIIQRVGYGRGTHIITDFGTAKDINDSWVSSFRTTLSNQAQNITAGVITDRINTSFGESMLMQSRFVRGERDKVPFEVNYPAESVANNTFKPTVAIDASLADGSSKFDANWAGNYYYLVTGVNANGESTGVLTAQTAVVAGKKVVLTITKSAADTETGYVIYRSRLNGTNALADLREIARIPQNSTGAPTVWTDLNTDLPGTSNVYMLNLSQDAAQAISWQQYIAMDKIPLATVDSLRKNWAQYLAGYLKIGQPRSHVVYKNVVPKNAAWKPK